MRIRAKYFSCPELKIDRISRQLDKASERFYLSNNNWRSFLGHSMFGLPLVERGTAFRKSQ